MTWFSWSVTSSTYSTAEVILRGVWGDTAYTQQSSRFIRGVKQEEVIPIKLEKPWLGGHVAWDKASLSPKHIIPVRWEHRAATAFIFQKAKPPPRQVRARYSQAEHSSYWSDRSHEQEILENNPALEKVTPILSPYSGHRKHARHLIIWRGVAVSKRATEDLII